MSGLVTGTEPGRQRRGLVRRRWRDERVVHLPGRRGIRRRRADHGRGGLHGRLAGAGRRAELPRASTRTRSTPTAPATTSTTSTRAGGPHRTPWACSRTTTPSSGTPATTSSPANPAGPAATPPGWRWTTPSRFATSSTRAAGCSTPGSTPAPSTRRGHADQLYDPTAANAQCRRRRGGAGAVPAPRRVGRLHQRHRCSTGSARTSSSTMPVRRRTEASSTSSASTRRSRAGLGVQRRRQRREPGPQQLVHHDERHPRPGRVPAVRELGRGQVGPRGRPVRAAHRRRLRLLADRRRVVQAPDPHDRRPGRWRHDVVLDVVRHRGRLGPHGRRGPHRGRRRLDDAA